jgi:glucosyl-3-phosphoglycerate synthase
MARPTINPALGLALVAERTLTRSSSTVSVIVPAHNEQETVAEVVREAYHGLEVLKVEGQVLVSASACTDATAQIAEEAGAQVVISPAGKGAAISAGLKEATGDILCLIDGDLRYFGSPPLVTVLVEPILHGIADACISDLYWRPLYPQLWLHGFFAPVAGLLFPELLPKVGSTPWSGQRAAMRNLWPTSLPTDFTADLALLLHWNEHAVRMRPVLADDWVNPQRPKPDLMSQELELLLREAVRQERIDPSMVAPIEQWYDDIHQLMATYQPDTDDPQSFERQILRKSLALLPQRSTTGHARFIGTRTSL